MAESEIERKRREIEEHIGRLEESQRELEQSLQEIDHQRRRVADRIERSGTDREAEREQARLTENRSINRRDFARNDKALEELRAEAAELQRQIERLRR